MTRKFKQHSIKRLLWLQINYGEDLLKSVSTFCVENNIRLGFISIIGALQKASFSCYQQKEKKYHKNLIDAPTEILSCVGNISIKEGKPFVHVHLTVADEKGNAYGGHLEEGTIVFACECAVFELEGDLLERKFDDLTGLSLWDFA